MYLRQAINELKKGEPTDREIRKKEQLVQIYLTISTILTALKQNPETIIIKNSTILHGASITQLERFQNFIQGASFLVFLLVIIVYYMYLGQKSKTAKKYVNCSAIAAGICFGLYL